MAPVELRIEDLRHHIHVESAVEAGARNAVKLLQNTRTPDKKALAEVQSEIFSVTCYIACCTYAMTMTSICLSVTLVDCDHILHYYSYNHFMAF